MSEYPQHEKLRELEDKRDTVQEFYDWLLGTKRIVLSRWGDGDDLYPVGITPEELIAEFLGIDLKEFRAESEEMYRKLRRDYEEAKDE